MYLKSIEVQGFKSFAHKIVFEFHNGITGIVGPNGSGKSNVADAVRWVLGEQRVKQLRGGNMQDVIFSGTENRKPLSYASVAITLDNSDHHLPTEYEEVTVTRKLYRSGESEYLLNGSTCRLKDINELFYDTGIGKEGYSIIGQGQIDKVLSGKPEDRRELFDEAAGIVKFKRRKVMSVKKLEEEQKNLLRVNDILSELEKQVGPLCEQSRTAKAYLKKKEELKIYDINLFLLETERLAELIKDLDAKIGIAQNELREAKQSYESMKQEYESVEQQMDMADAEIEKFRNRLNETTILRQQLENQIDLLKEQIHSMRMSDDHYDRRSETIHTELDERAAQMEELSKEEVVLKEELNTKTDAEEIAKRALAEVQTAIAVLTQKLETNKNEIIELLNNRAFTRAKMQRYDTMLEQIQVRKAQMTQRLISSESEACEQRELLEKHNAKLKHISGQIQSLLEESKNCESEIQRMKGILAVQEQKLKEGQAAYHREQSRLETLKNMTERYEGFGVSIRKVMEQKKKDPGILGVVADIIKVEKTYEIAIETALGGSIQNIVTDREETAKRMIAFLKKNRFGRATFLPLTGITEGSGIQRPEVLKEPGVIGVASELVDVPDSYRQLSRHLLGRTVVVDHIDHGIAIARKYRHSIRLVTVEGELLNPGGSMTGGTFRNSGNLLSRRREIEESERNVLRLREEMDAIEQDSEQLRRKRSESYDRVEEIQRQLQEAYVVQNTEKMSVEQANERIQSIRSASLQIQNEGKELERQITDISDNQESIALELETSEHMEASLTEQIEAGGRELEEQRKQEAARQQEAEAAHLDLAALQQRQEFLAANRTRIEEETEKLQEELMELRSGKDLASREITGKEQQIQEICATIDNSKELFEEIEKEIQKNTEAREKLNQKHKAFLSAREELSGHISDLDREIFRLESRREGYGESSDRQISYMWDEYEVTLNRAMELKDNDLTDLAVIKKKIQQLKGEIRNLGPVNVNAIDDYKRISERYEFLKTQRDDLEEAGRTLMNIIEELDNAMRKQFTEQFAKIAKEFDVVFKELFGGGSGTLELVEAEDVLDAGIRIVAQPPGKKLQNMMQLSGGEKALTAIALLFAIQNLKPSPFCLLDEIEAALDDSNVVRFARYLHKLTKNTQFIVITHRRGTMTAADRLYGITMQEKGVSTLVSVSLLEDELEQ